MRVRGVLGLLRSAVLSTCRSWRTRSWGTSRYAQVGPCFHAKELCVAHGGQCAKLSFPQPDVCKSPSSKVMVVDDVSSTCLSPKQTPRHLARNVHMLAHVQQLFQAVGPCARSRLHENYTKEHYITVQSMRIRSQK